MEGDPAPAGQGPPTDYFRVNHEKYNKIDITTKVTKERVGSRGTPPPGRSGPPTDELGVD